MIAEATVDCYNDSEQVCGLYTMIEDNLAMPFSTAVLGMKVIVERVDMRKRMTQGVKTWFIRRFGE